MVLNNNLITNQKIMPQTVNNFYAERYWADSQDSIANADRALYEVKQQGRGHYRFFTPATPAMAAAGA